MKVGFVGSGNMAAAMARGWAAAAGGPDRMLFSDGGSGRATELAGEVGGEAVADNAAVAAGSDLVVLAVKPAALEAAATEIAAAEAVVSLLGATPLTRLREALPDAAVARVMPNVAVEVGRGVLCLAAESSVQPGLVELLEALGTVVEMPDEQFDVATALMGCSPAYVAVVLAALCDAGAANGLDPSLARRLVVDAAAGSAELLRERGFDEVRDAVTSPGGSTEAGLAALAREGGAEAVGAAVHASLARMRGEL